MKKIIIALAMLSAFAVGCQKSEPSGQSVSGDVFTATVETFDAQTKTAMTPEKQIVWSANDRLAIFQGSSLADEYKVSSEYVGQMNGKFTRVSSAENDDYSSGMELSTNVAFYPYAENLSLTGSVLEDETVYSITGVVIPSTQTYVAGSFGNGAFPMVAVTETMADHNLKFKNVLGAMKLQLKGAQTVKSIKIEGKNKEKLSGAATITAKTNNLTPTIILTGTDETSKSVTLDCGTGVALNENTATDFIIALPPVLFTNGFTVTVTDIEDKAYTIETSTANTVLRSSILAMPVVKLEASDNGTPEDGEDDDATYAESVYLNKNSLKMMPNTSFVLVADIDPVDVTYPTLTWSSSDNAVATVDQNGTVTALSDGTATITALAVGGESASCEVEVKSPVTFAEGDYKDYVDELGVNHGKGIAVAGVIWAPVNCGYEPATADYKGYPYGKLYQWGRKYGQGYDDNDATYPSGDNLIKGPVMPSWGSLETYKDAFFYGSYDWCNQRLDDLWVDSEGKKTKKDPCPSGWRVPTLSELAVLSSNYSSWTTNDNQKGYYFVGEYTYIENLPQVFFPAAGYRNYDIGIACYRGDCGNYWSSSPDGSGANYLRFNSGGVGMDNFSRAYGYSVRCVQEID